MGLREAFSWGLTPGGYDKLLQRHHAIAAWAAENSLTYSWDDPYALTTLPFAFFRQTRPVKGTFGVVAGKWKGSDVYVADYHCRYYSIDEWDDPLVRTVVIVPLPGSVPALLAHNRAGWVRRFPREWGFQKVETGDAAFDKPFSVHSVNVDYARWVLNPAWIRESLLAAGRMIALELNQMNLLITHEMVPLERLSAFVDLAVTIVGQIPEQVWQWYPRPPAVG